MVRQSRLGLWIGVALGVALLATCLVLGLAGTGEKPTRLALEITARWSFLLFWLAYSGNALVQLTGWERVTGHGRELGLSFAAAHLVHIGLVVWLSYLLGRVALTGGLLIFFLVGIFFVYLLAALSFGGVKAIGRQAWRVIRFVGMNYILIAFGRDFVLPVLHPKPAQHTLAHFLAYAPFAFLSVAAPLLVLAVSLRPRTELKPEAGL
jgi:hypothetical protein